MLLNDSLLRYDMSAGIRDRLQKLSLKKGDILLPSDPWIQDTLVKMKPPEELNFSIPIIYAPNLDDLRTVGREKLEEALRLLDNDKS